MLDNDNTIGVIDRFRMREVRGEIIALLCVIYGQKNNWLSLKLLRKNCQQIELEPELRYLKESGYIEEDNRIFFRRRLFRATTKAYTFYTGDMQDETIYLPD